MKRVFVFEYLSAGGDDAPAELMAQGRAMRDAMVRDLAACAGVAVTVAAPSMRRGGESAAAFVARMADAHDAVWLVAPESGGVLLDLARAVAPARWLGCTREAIALASSKRATLVRCAAHGIATPLALAQAQRWVVKPDDGAGAIDTRVHASLLAAQRDRDARAQPAWLEPWVEGDALSASLLCARGDAEVLAVNRQRIAVGGNGGVHFDGVEVDAIHGARREAVASFARSVARAVPGLRGIVGIDLVWRAEHGPVLIEVNPRVTSAYVGLSQALGRNVAADLLASCFEQAEHV